MLKKELASYSSQEKAFLFFAMLCGFFICCEYSIIRPVSNALFIHSYSARFFPYAWLALVPFNFLFVSLYNRLLPKWGSKKIFLVLLFTVISTNMLMGFFGKKFPFLSFGFYMWKEIYVLWMFQLLWSVIHSNVSLSKAKYLYGIFFGIGGMGSMFGSAFPSFFAVAYGSETILFLTLPVYLCLCFFYLKMSQYSTGEVPKEDREKKGGFLHGIQLITRSRFLIFILLIVVFMQMSLAIVDFQFNHFLEKTITLKDLRTEYAGRIFGIMHALTVVFQFIGSYFLVQFVGLKKAHYLAPLIVALSACSLVVFPIFAIASLTFVLLKSLDFSLFGVIKEMLYIPLKPDEKYRAKAVIDVFAYRSSKAIASGIIILVQAFVVEIVSLLTWINIFIAFIWILSISYGLREYEKISRSEGTG